MQIIDYTEKSIVVVGDTLKIKDSLKLYGGKWNPNLKNKDGTVFKGWIFPQTKKDLIQNLIKEE